ncbi:palm2akap2 [Pungitius sinensis]
MKKQRKGNAAASIAFSSPPENSSVQVCTDYQRGASVTSGNAHAVENGSENRRDRTAGRERAGGMCAVPDVASNSRDPRCSMKDEGVGGDSTWAMDSSSRACLGPEDNSTDPHETLTESSTLTFVDVHALEESAEGHSLHGLGMVYLKEFVLIDDDDDGDMSLREKTVTDLSVMDGKAADLVCGRFLSTSSGSLSECKGEFEARDAPPAEDAEAACEKQRCCFCTVS